jgi:hypothetical protein
MGLTKEQREAITRQGTIVRECLRAVKLHRFEIGNILIKKCFEYNYKTGTSAWKAELFSENRTALRKYKVVAVDEFEIPFIRKILYKGVLHKELIYLGNHDCSYTKYEIDPELQFHIILGNHENNFDPQDSYRKERFGEK